MTAGIVDFHAHLDDWWLEHPLMDRSTFLAGLDQCGVARACIFTIMGFYNSAREGNDRLLAHAAACPDRLMPFLSVDPKEGQAALDEAKRCLALDVFKGMKFHPWMQAFAPSMVQDTMDKLLRLAADHDVPVLFHDGTPPYSTTFQIANQARRVPEAKIVLGHGGLADYTEAAAQLAAELPNLYVCTCCPKAGDLRYLVEKVGAEKVLFGSDFGIADWRVLAERLDDLNQAGLSDADLQCVLSTSAMKLLHIDE